MQWAPALREPQPVPRKDFQFIRNASPWPRHERQVMSIALRVKNAALRLEQGRCPSIVQGCRFCCQVPLPPKCNPVPSAKSCVQGFVGGTLPSPGDPNTLPLCRDPFCTVFHIQRGSGRQSCLFYALAHHTVIRSAGLIYCFGAEDVAAKRVHHSAPKPCSSMPGF